MGLFDNWTAPAASDKPFPFASPAPEPAAPAKPSPFGGSAPYLVAAAKPLDIEGSTEERASFVLAYLRNPRDPYSVALKLFGTRPQFAQAIAVEWPRLEWFRAACDKLIEEHGEEAFLPSKAQIARELYDAAQSNAWDTEASIKFYKLYCEVMDYVKGGAGVTVNNNQQNNSVLIVRDFGTDDEWEEKARVQQAKLVANA